MVALAWEILTWQTIAKRNITRMIVLYKISLGLTTRQFVMHKRSVDQMSPQTMSGLGNFLGDVWSTEPHTIKYTIIVSLSHSCINKFNGSPQNWIHRGRHLHGGFDRDLKSWSVICNITMFMCRLVCCNVHCICHIIIVKAAVTRAAIATSAGKMFHEVRREQLH